MKLPNAENAIIDLRKLRDYCLSETHSVGQHKAKVFRAALGLTDRDAERVRDMILEAVQGAEAESSRADEFGTRYHLDFAASTEAGSATIRTSWIVKTGESAPRLTSCYVLKRT